MVKLGAGVQPFLVCVCPLFSLFTAPCLSGLLGTKVFPSLLLSARGCPCMAALPASVVMEECSSGLQQSTSHFG